MMKQYVSLIGGGVIGLTIGLFCNQSLKNYTHLEKVRRITSKAKNSGSSNGKPPLVLISCGSFSPVTNMHLRLFEEARNFLRDDFDVRLGIISPTNDGYKKHKSSLIHSKHRLQMARFAVVNSDWIEVSDYEVRQSEWQRTRPTLTHYKKVLQEDLGADVEVRFLCGADILEAMCKPNGLWRPKDVQYILKEFGIAAICRKNSPDLKSYIQEQDLLRPFANRIHLIVPEVENNVSSSLIRALLKEKKSISFLIPSAVEKYIYENELFSSSQDERNL